MADKDEIGLGSIHQMTVGGSLGSKGDDEATVIASSVHRPGLAMETLVYLKDTPIKDILNDSSAVAGFHISEVEIEDIQEKIKRSGFPIKVGGGVSGEGANFELELKSKEEIKNSRKVKIRYSR